MLPSRDQVRDLQAHGSSQFHKTAHLGGGHVFEQLRKLDAIARTDAHMKPTPETETSPDIIGRLESWQSGAVRIMGGSGPEPPVTEGNEDKPKSMEHVPEEAGFEIKQPKRRKFLPWNKPAVQRSEGVKMSRTMEIDEDL